MKRFSARAAALLASGAIAGGVLAGTLSANAATTSSGTSSGTGPSGTASPPANAFSSTPVRSDESAVSSSLAATLTQKAEAKTGGTVYRVETDAGDAAYEAHVRMSDGTLVTVTFDKSSAITAVETGMGKGDPMPSGSAPGGTAG